MSYGDGVVGRILGPLEVTGPTGAIRPRAAKHRILIGGLLLRANQRVTVTEILDWLWGDAPPVTALPTLRTYVMRVRRELAPASPDRPWIRSESDGYTLSVPAYGSDLLQFRELVARARQLADDPLAALEHLRDAERLWRGPALADVASDRLHRDEVPRLTEEWMCAVERRVDAELAVGRHAELVGELRELTAKHPLRERFWAQLMVALHRGGRQAEALECYRAVRSVLAEEFGVEPGEELRRRHQQVLHGEAAPTAGADWPRQPRARSSPHPARRLLGAPDRRRAGAVNGAIDILTDRRLGGRAGNPCLLPPDDAGYVGRQDELRRARARLMPDVGATAVPILVVAGPPGVGKTAFAIHLAHQVRDDFPDGQWYVDLGGATNPRDPDDVLAEVLPACPSSWTTELRTAALRARLADRQILVVLDDAATAEQVRSLLPGTATSAVLVTSRRSLPELTGASRIRLDPLTEHDAYQLLAGQIGESRAAAEPAAVEQIAAACCRLPLALRIAAARLALAPDAPLAAFGDRLGERGRRLDELTLGAWSVRSAVAGGYAGLGEPAQQAFRRLGLLGGGTFAAWLLGALDAGVDVDRVVEALVEHGLIAPAGRDETGQPCYHLPYLLGDYAAELAAAEPADVSETALRRLAAHKAGVSP